MRLLTRTSIGAVAILGLTGVVAFRAFASTTDVQDGGTACLADIRNPSAFIWRTSDGFQNTGADPIGVYCPLSKTSGDSDTEGTFDISDLEMYYAGPTPTNCSITCRDENTGSVITVNAMAPRTNSNFFLPSPPAIVGASTTLHSVCAGALGISCLLPGGSTIIGTVHTDIVPDVDQGV